MSTHLNIHPEAFTKLEKKRRRQRHTADLIKCMCGNVAAQGTTECGRCASERERREAELIYRQHRRESYVELETLLERVERIEKYLSIGKFER